MPPILTTGFEPFDGRDVNASWIAARCLAELQGANALQLPVVWGAPMRLLAPLLTGSGPKPGAVISLGEGRPGWFDIETRARVERGHRTDNSQRLPEPRLIVDHGPAELKASINAARLQRALSQAGFPARISSEAGAYLCEETLYTLELLKQQHADLRLVTFIHLPPFGSRVRVNETNTYCDESVLNSFALTLGRALLTELALLDF
ncbi:MAG: hypothetical protein ACFHX7_04045 [Pseudomonadota bacterium]